MAGRALAQPVPVGGPAGYQKLGPGPLSRTAGGPSPPSLDLSFMTPGTLPPGVTFTRASGAATYFDVTGTMQSVSGNTPRWDYDPVTHVLKGFLIEPARTNLLLNSATLGTQSVAVTAQAYTLSFYGTGTITLSGASTAGPLTGTGPTRVALSFTPTAGTLTLTVTGTVQNAQLEAAAFASSYIATFGTTQGRGNEITTAATGAWFTQGVGSLSTEFIINGASGFPRITSLNDGTANNEIMHLIGASAGRVYSASTLAGVAGWAMGNNSTYVANAVAKMATSWQAGAQLFNMNAVQPQSAAQAGVPSGITQLMLGHDTTGATTEVIYMRRVRYWPRALSATELQQVTT